MQREIPLIAVIDGDIGLNTTISAALTNAGYYTIPCVSGAAAAQVVVEELPDLVIVAMHTGGEHVVATMQRHVGAAAIPVIVYANDWRLLQGRMLALQEAGCMVLHQATLTAHLLAVVESIIGAPLLARML